jgi:N-methylhydantoinase B
MPSANRFDPIELEIFKSLFHSIAEEMGAALKRTAFSPNIKERRDYSCAVFDATGEAIAMGDHMPVHLGSMPMSVRAAIEALPLGPGDVAMLNDPFSGGTHLPDVTLVAPVFVERSTSKVRAARNRLRQRSHSSRPDFFVASRAHHADIGGAFAGSMGPCREIYQEGLRIPPVHLVRAGVLERDALALLLANVRTPEEREGDLNAQLAACHTGANRLRELCGRYTSGRVQGAASELLNYSEQMMRAFLAHVPPGIYRSEDSLDDDGVIQRPVKIRVAIHVAEPQKSSGRRGAAVRLDFTGSDAQVEGNVNAVEAITYSACFYVFRCLLAEDVPATAGLMRPVRVIAPAGTVVNARPPAAVAGGNVETSQRIVDVLLGALAQAVPHRIPAGSSGTMNNLTIGGLDPRSGSPFAYYETIAGGMGARPGKDGVSAVHTHMTNSLNTPIEALEYAYPFRVTEYSIRPVEVKNDARQRLHSARKIFRGGRGVVREIELLADAQVAVLADRRKRGPYGLGGAPDGKPGRTEIIRGDGKRDELPGKTSTRLRPGERIRIESPGGGSWM